MHTLYGKSVQFLKNIVWSFITAKAFSVIDAENLLSTDADKMNLLASKCINCNRYGKLTQEDIDQG